MNISTLTLSRKSSVDGTYCNELNSMIYDSFNNNEQLRNIFEPFFHLQFPHKSCMIWLTNVNGSSLKNELEECLRNWFPNKHIPIWGGEVHNISVCNHDPNEHANKYDSKSVTILIRGTKINIWSFYFDKMYSTSTSISNELKIQKELIKLRKKSIGFIFTSKTRLHLHAFESSIFQEHFPRMPIIKYSGYGVYGVDFRNLRKSENTCRLEETVFMIISYD